MKETKRVLIVAQVHPVLVRKLRDLGYVCDQRETIPYEEVMKIIHIYDGIITSNKLSVDAQLIDAASRLKWIGRLGSGMEIIDVAYAGQRNISCYSSPEGNANAVAEQALGMLLALQHRILKSHLELLGQEWLRDENRGIEIEGKTAGIIGLGNNGSAFARKLQALGLRVLAFDQFRNNYDMQGVEACDSLDPLFEQADVISFHVPLNSETRYYFNDDFLNKMHKPFVLLNLSRGPVVSLASLYQGMNSGKVSGAALDVWEQEPYWKNRGSLKQISDSLMRHPHFIGTPHTGGYSIESLYKMSWSLGEKIAKHPGEF